MGCSESLPPIPPRFVAFAWRYHDRDAVLRVRPLGRSRRSTSRRRRAWGFASPVAPCRLCSWRRRGFPGSWGTPMWTCPALRPRRDRWARPFSAQPMLPSAVTTSSAPAMPNFLRGSITRPIHWLSTLRSRDRSRTTQDSLPAAGLLYRVGLATHGVPMQGL